MKNEGPFIVEWIAHHRAIGVNHFVIFSNDCSDGTKELLDALDDAGIIRHLENPNCLVNATQALNVAFEYARHLKEYQRATHVALIDADEFINVKSGDGTLPGFLNALSPFDILSFNHVNFGFGGIKAFKPDPLTEQFFLAGGEDLGVGVKVRTAIKSIHRVCDEIKPLNHFPWTSPESRARLRWIDGSGTELQISNNKPRRKMLRAEGRTAAIQLNHYVLRSIESFLVKHDRGNVFGFEKVDAIKYAKSYNHNRVEDRTILHTRSSRDREIAELLGLPEIQKLHESCVQKHRDRIKELLGSDDGRSLYSNLVQMVDAE